MINKFSYVLYWKVISTIFLSLIFFKIYRISNEVTYLQSEDVKKSENIIIEFDVCYDLNLNKDVCKAEVFGVENAKDDFNCKFEKPISCYTKDFDKKTPKDIINSFKECKLENFVNVESESNLTIRSEDEIQYELFSGFICVKYKFNVQSDTELSLVKIYPDLNNKQNFHVIVHTTRTYKNGPTHHSFKSHLFERYCWTKNQTEKKYFCTEDNKEILFELIYFSQINLEYPMDTDCVYRKNRNQHQCYEDCFRKSIKYYRLTYNENDESILSKDKKLALDNVKKCTNECRQPDCVEGTFQIPTLVESNSTSENFVLVKINNQDKPTLAVPVFNKIELLYLIIMYTCLFYGFNFYWLFFKVLNMYNNPVKKSKKYKLIDKKVIGLIIMVLIGLTISLIIEKKLFNFGKYDQILFTKIDSIKERNVSISVCYNLCNILKNGFNSTIKEKCNDKLLMKLSLKDLNLATWDSFEFRKESSMRNSVRIYPIRQKDFWIGEFFRDFKRCYLLFYEGKNLYPPISLQRKSQIHVNSSSGLYDYFYIEDGLTYPQLDTPKNKTSFLHNIHIVDYNGRNCVNYENFYQNWKCRSRDECIQQCVLKNYVNEHNSIPIYVNVKLNDDSSYSNFTFEDDLEKFKKIRDKCESNFKRNECYSIRTSLRTKFVETHPHDISVTLTPKIFSRYRMKDESLFIVMNRVLSFLIILTGFSIKDMVKGFVETYLFSLATLYNFQFINRIAYLIVFLLFLIHFSYLFYSLINQPIFETSYRLIMRKIELPKVRLCMELDDKFNLNDNSVSLKYLRDNTANLTDVLDSITLLDENHEKRVLNVQEVQSNSLINTYDFMIDNFRCFNFKFKSEYDLLNTNTLDADKLVIFVLKLDKLPRERMFIHMNSDSLDFEWYYPFSTGYHNLIYIIEDYIFQDDYWIIKNFYAYIKNLFKLDILKSTHKSYYNHLRDSFLNEQYFITTIVPLGDRADENATIKNSQFNSYIHFRSLAGTKNNYNFNVNNRKLTFMSDVSSEKSYLGDNYLVFALRTVLLKYKMVSLNKYRLIEFFLHLFILIVFWFQINIATLPESIRKAFPIAKFFVICFLYCIVVFLLFLFETWFKLIRFLDFKYA